MTPSSVLRAARDLVAKGHGKQWEPPRSQYVAWWTGTDAIERVSCGHWSSQHNAEALLRSVVGVASVSEFIDWADAGRTQAEVLKAFGDAIELAEKEGQ